MNKLPIATLINTATVIIGSLIGMGLENIFTDDIKSIVFQAVGLGTILIAIKMILKIPDGYILLAIFSLITGGIIGEFIQLDDNIVHLSESLKSFLSISDNNFSDGLITAFLLFCVGSMTIVGALEEGLNQNRELIYIKSALDGFAAIALASSLGIGVLFSAIPLLLFQGSLTLLANRLKSIFDQDTLDLISAVGGLLIFGISINMLNLGNINLENMLPALMMCIVFSKIYQRYQKSV